MQLPKPDQQHPRAGSKQALLVNLLGRAGGATIDDLTGATGWLPHTARAALTGLRKRGFAVERISLDRGESAYRISAPEPEPASKRKRRGGRVGSAKAAAAA